MNDFPVELEDDEQGRVPHARLEESSPDTRDPQPLREDGLADCGT